MKGSTSEFAKTLYEETLCKEMEELSKIHGEIRIIKGRKRNYYMVESCQFCNKPAFKSNGNSELICENRANFGDCNGLRPLIIHNKEQRRNELCRCGSGKKYKFCCMINPKDLSNIK